MKALHIFLFFTAFFLFSCSPSKENQEVKHQVKSIDTPRAVVSIPPIDTFYNNIAQLLGGQDTLINYKNNLWDKSFIKKYALKVKKKYNQIEVNRLQKIAKWNELNLKRNNQSDSNFVFYPFSGGDFIHLKWLYPMATEYFMIAREDVGSIPNLYVKDAAFVNKYLNDIDTVLRDIYFKSYFITKNMEIDTKSRTLVNGMLPLIIWALAITENEILDISFFNISDSSDVVYDRNANNPQKNHDGVEIVFRMKDSNVSRKLIYLSCDISDNGFKKSPRFYSYIIKKLPFNCNSFVKSASYLLHYQSFKTIRDIIQERSNFLVQDDTGIPYKYFKDENWNVELFGKYTKPVKDFSEERVFQKDLDSAYKNEKYFKGNLDFSLGYHWGSNFQNQMVLKKK